MNKDKKHRVAAFTIMELTVAMLIASMVIGMTYTIYTIVVGSYRSFHTKNNEMALVIRLDELLKRDFAQADVIVKNEQGISCKSTDQLVTYAVGPGFIVRKAAAIDTFKVNVQDITTAFEAVPVSGTAGDEEQNRIDELTFNLLVENEKIPYYYHKSYSSQNLILRNSHAVN